LLSLPLSPTTVYRYINGDEARFTGFELQGEIGLGPYVDLRVASVSELPRLVFRYAH